MVRCTEHAARERDPVGHIKEQYVFRRLDRVRLRRDVRMHLGQPRQQVATGPIDTLDRVVEHDLVCRPDSGDAPVGDHDRLGRDHTLRVHRHHGHIHERDIRGDDHGHYQRNH